MSTRWKAALVATALTASTAVQAQPTASRAQAGVFLDQLKRAVDSADRGAVAGLVAYPLTVLASGFNIPIKDPAGFVRTYDSVFTPELRCALVSTEIPAPGAAPTRLSAVITPDGLSLVDGAVWAPFKEGRYRIARIRVLPAVPSVEGRKGIERVTFAPSKGERMATFAGWLIRQNIDAFVATVRKGETLQARIEGFRGHDATVRVSLGTPAPSVRGSTPSDNGRATSITAAADADYRVEVAHLGRYCDPPQRYRLTITIR
jgi:hypothetical protein